MPCFKALIAKDGAILSITEEKDKPDGDCKVQATPEAKFPDIVFVSGKNVGDATAEVKNLIKNWEINHH